MSPIEERLRRRLELHARGTTDAAYWALLDDVAEAADELEWLRVERAVWRAYANVRGVSADIVDQIMSELRRQAGDAGLPVSDVAARIDEFLYGPTGLIGGMR